MIIDDIITYNVTDAKGCKKRERKRGWFSRLFAEKKAEEPAPPEWSAAWELVKCSFPIGRRFGYLGREMIVTRHRPHVARVSVPRAFVYIPENLPAIIAEYADECGEIHEHVFERPSWPILTSM